MILRDDYGGFVVLEFDDFEVLLFVDFVEWYEGIRGRDKFEG